MSLAAASLAPAALAADADVYQGWVAHDADFCKLGKKTRKQTRTWSRSPSKKTEKHLLATFKSTRALIGQVIADVAAQATSTDAGARAKTYVQRSNRELDAAVHEAARAVRAATAGHAPGARAHGRAANRHSAKGLKDERIARKAFTKAGVTIKKNPNSCGS